MPLDLYDARAVYFMNHCIIVCANNVGEMALCLHQNMDLLWLTEDEYDKNGRVNAQITGDLLIYHH